MMAEIRETMVFQAPQELAGLWGKFEAMWQQILVEQEAAHAEELRLAQIAAWRRRKKVEAIKAKAAWLSAAIFVVLYGVFLMWLTTKSAMMKTSLGHY
jgi:hypothetical protein